MGRCFSFPNEHSACKRRVAFYWCKKIAYSVRTGRQNKSIQSIVEECTFDSAFFFCDIIAEQCGFKFLYFMYFTHRRLDIIKFIIDLVK